MLQRRAPPVRCDSLFPSFFRLTRWQLSRARRTSGRRDPQNVTAQPADERSPLPCQRGLRGFLLASTRESLAESPAQPVLQLPSPDGNGPFLNGSKRPSLRPRTLGENHHVYVMAHDLNCGAHAIDGRLAVMAVHRNHIRHPHRSPQNWYTKYFLLNQH